MFDSVSPPPPMTDEPVENGVGLYQRNDGRVDRQLPWVSLHVNADAEASRRQLRLQRFLQAET